VRKSEESDFEGGGRGNSRALVALAGEALVVVGLGGTNFFWYRLCMDTDLSSSNSVVMPQNSVACEARR